MEYLLVNPFSAGTSRGAPSGIDSYVRSVRGHMPARLSVRVLENANGMDRRGFQEYVRREVSALDPAHWVIEAPEARASTLLLPDEYFTHIRLHCPAALAQYHDDVPVDTELLREELGVVRRARVLSAPSTALKRELAAALPQLEIGVYRHPPPQVESITCERDIDALFLGRSQRLKGVDLLPAILRGLPRDFRVVLAGDGLVEMRLGRGIRCHVDRLPTVRGRERDVLLHRARVVMLPSRFESFSMVLGEAMAAGTCVVAWCSSAPAEIAPAPLVRIACHGDTRAFARSVIDGARGPRVAAALFDGVLAEWARDFGRGVEWVLARGRGAAAPAPAPSDFRGTHRLGAPPEPALHRIVRGEMRPTPRPSSFQRKLSKLRRDPKGFFRDSRIEPLRRWLGGEAGALPPTAVPAPAPRPSSRSAQPSAPTSWSVSSEPRYLGSVRAIDGKVVVERLDKKIAEPHLATIVFSTASAQPFRMRPTVSALLADKSFVGFRDRYLFVMEDGLGESFTRPDELIRLIDASPSWGQRPTRGARNAVFVHPSNVLPYAVRATDHAIRLVVCASEATPRLHLLERFGRSIDVLVAPESLDARYRIDARRRIRAEERDFPAVIRSVVMQHRDPEKNMLIPVFGAAELVDDIDALNQRELDGVIWLSEPCPCAGKTLDDLVDEMAARARTVLLRESRWHQYRDDCERGDVGRLLRLSLEDGCRYEIRS